MEPIPNRHDASAGLAAVDAAQKAVRDRPWPLWLYPTNTLLLGGLALTGLIESSVAAAFVVLPLALAFGVINLWAGRLIGAPFAIPTSRGFLLLTALAAAFTVLTVVLRGDVPAGVILACAAGAMISYAAGSVLHRRSTRP